MSGNPRWVVCLLLFPLLLPLASASGGGLLLDASTLVIAGDQEVGAGDVNITVEVRAHDVDANGSLEMSLVAADGTPLASHNRSISLTSGNGVVEVFDIAAVPLGSHTLTLRLWGEVGAESGQNLTQITTFVQRLAPASIQFEDPETWTVVPVDADAGEASGNATFRNGDLGWVHAELTNTGDVDWVGEVGGIRLSLEGQSVDSSFWEVENWTFHDLTVPGGTTLSVNLSLDHAVTETSDARAGFNARLNDSNPTTSATLWVDVGPPPLATPILNLDTEAADPALGDEVNWTVRLDNAGEAAAEGALNCTFPDGIEVLGVDVSLPPGDNLTHTLSITVRPGVLECSLSTPGRLHDTSVLSASEAYEMAAGHLLAAGSDGLTVSGGPFHVGDAVPLAVLVHNGGDLAGDADLQIRTGAAGESGGPWTALDTRTLEVGSSLELGGAHTALVAGERSVEWRVVSADSLVDAELSGTLDLSVLPAQSLEIEVRFLTWTLADGLEIEVLTELSAGETRPVTLQLGTEGAGGQVEQIRVDLTLSPGQRTLVYNLGQPTASSKAWATATPLGWTASGTAAAEATLIRPDPSTRVTFDRIDPGAPVTGERVTIDYSLVNEGGGATLEGELTLIDLADHAVLWTGPVGAVASGETTSGTFSLSSWPDGSVVDLSLEWRTTTTVATGTDSWISGTSEEDESASAFDWTALIYGALGGLMLGLVTRTVMRARAGASILPKRTPRERRPRPEAAADNKVEVACPACDQRLRVPSTYSGTARCPACAQTFPVEAAEVPEPEPEPGPEAEDEPETAPDSEAAEAEEEVVEVTPAEESSASPDDVIRCPDCSQKLKVPYDRRPVKARCPACRCEFRALKE